MVFACCSYQSQAEDLNALKVKEYRLENGLTVWLNEDHSQPKVFGAVVVKAGAKDCPDTGIAHYFEHMMFKGTDRIGTLDYESEKVLLDSIAMKYDELAMTEDTAARARLQKEINELSIRSSEYVIPNEFNRLINRFGGSGLNAATSYDATIYFNTFSPQYMVQWAEINSERLINPVFRLFQSELETVYEEKNMSLTRDPRKVYEAVLSSLFPHHPYGTQTVLGTQEDLKNPSITNIKEYYKKWYVPNNMAICLSGDFDPDQMIATIDKYFGGLKPNPDLPKLDLPKETPITVPVVREILGPDAESVALAWRFPGAADKDVETLQVVSQILYNGQAGLIDLDLTQQQKTLSAYYYPSTRSDYSAFMMQGRPKQGQTLDEVKDLLLGELKKLREGDFDEKMLEANINNFKLYQMQQLENNDARADMFVESFVNGSDWADEVTALDRMSKLTKDDIVAFANKYLKDDNYAVIYKKQGKDPNEKKMSKPEITPIVMNRDTVSTFLKEIQASVVTPIEPVFLDYSKDLTQLKAKSDIPVIYKQNTTNDIFQLIYLFDMGNNNDKALGTAAQYLEYLGTADMTPEEVKSEFYRLACSFFVSPGAKRTYVVLSGLSENMPAAMALFEKLMANAKVNPEAYTNMANDILKSRKDAKLNQMQNFSRLVTYATYGPKSPSTNILTEAELTSMDPQQLVDRIKQLNSFKHRILYYGPNNQDELLAIINKEHQAPETLNEIPEGNNFEPLLTPETKIFIAPYEAKQIYMSQVSNKGEKFDPAAESGRQLYNEYFGGGMNSIVFQEMRESRGLAYSAWAGMLKPSYLTDPYTLRTQIATQNDKMIDAINTFNDIINNMPESEAAFKLAKDGMIARMRTDRTIKMDVIWDYISAQYLGQNVDSRIKLYNDVQNMTLQDVIDYQNKWIKGRTYTYCILGDKKELDMESLKKVGPVIELKQEDIFGY